ncbi:MAG: DUF4199 domain-containing protein [Bacteroidales bacterium]|nr:DUF4199 domain-containing protein [Bacteroidales bacterium]
MDHKVSAWKANINAGVILGLLGIIWTLMLWFFDQTTNQTLSMVFYVVIIAGLFLGIRSYRDKYLNGFITYGQSLGAGVIIMLYYSVIMAVFTFLLYKFIDPNLLDKTLALAEEQLADRGMSEGMIEQSMQIQKKIMTPVVMSVSFIFGGVFVGTILSLIISLFTKREGNPLIESIEEEEE